MAMTHVEDGSKAARVTTGVQGIVAGATILTLDGALPVEFLNPGDRVLTRAGMRRIVAVEITVVQNARLVRISQNALGVGKPAEDVTVSAAQGVLLRDWRAKALYGAAQAVVPASRLVDGEYIRAETAESARLYTLVFAEAEVIYAGGLELACEGVKVRA